MFLPVPHTPKLPAGRLVNLKRRAAWLPTHEGINRYIHHIRTQAKARAPHLRAATSKHTDGLRKLIENNAIIRMYFEEMIQQRAVGEKETEHPKFDSVQELLDCIDVAVSSAPVYSDSDLVGFPVNALLFYMMATPAGFACFRDSLVNVQFRHLLNLYGKYLQSPESASVLNTTDEGWLNPKALEKLHLEEIECDPTDPQYGFRSWNEFFIRPFKSTSRPVDSADNHKVITSGCESAPFALKNDVKLYDSFWLKDQPYSLYDVFNGDPLVHEFVGGIVYQAFLSALNYHRWHAPVSGTIVKDPVIIPGTYYSEAEAEELDPAGPDLSQGYLTAVAARSLVFIKADDPTIGLIAITHVGMAEVSSCVFTKEIKQGHHVNKGDEIGRFEFGGSTHAMFFRKGTVNFDSFPKPNLENHQIIKLNTKLAVASDYQGN